ncbi:hypothetical protein [[Clostridium] innocuum]|uniref:hypothetical protein n=1 Tax=Clostridium innocuum TaxID=1522 RepID=UPI000D6C5F8D|nr:hypothetical protein [[Clostridium] innocuum]PWJ10476.1 hypothetical protein ATF84_12127 [[Clostridium] innocuum]SSA48879.1 hypothetical protein SAMN04487929_12127 [[Clostridium] innocuum]
MENKEFTELSMEEQLALLDEDRDQHTHSDDNDSSDEESFEESEEPQARADNNESKKLSKSKKIILGFISILVFAIGTTIYLNVIKDNKEPDESPKDKVAVKQPIDNVTIENRIEIPTDIDNKEEFVNVISKTNKVTHSYLEEIREIIINYIDRDRNDIYIETELDVYKKSLLSDIERFAKYKTLYEKFGASDLYTAAADRLQNAYDITRTSKNVMSEKALIANTNSYIDKEQEINTRVKVALMSFMDANDIEFDQRDDKIVYKISDGD